MIRLECSKILRSVGFVTGYCSRKSEHSKHQIAPLPSKNVHCSVHTLISPCLIESTQHCSGSGKVPVNHLNNYAAWVMPIRLIVEMPISGHLSIY